MSEHPEILRVAADAVSLHLGERRNFKITARPEGGYVTFTANVWPSDPNVVSLTNISDWREHSV